MTDNYIPFGEEWKKEVMKAPKSFITDQFRYACLKLQEKDARIKYLEKELEDLRTIYENKRRGKA